MRLWINNESTPEGKYLVVRRDGTIPQWPHFVMGAQDPAVPEALEAYAERAEELGYDPAMVADVLALAEDFREYRSKVGDGDPDAAPHRTDDPRVIAKMRSGGHVFGVSLGTMTKEEIDKLPEFPAADTPQPTEEPDERPWAVLELMGHVRLVGIVTEEEKFGTKVGRIDVLQADGSFVTQYFGGSSIYRLTPTEAQTAKRLMTPPIAPLPYRRRLDEDDEL